MFKRFSILAIAGAALMLAAPGAFAQAKGPAAKKPAAAPAPAPAAAPASSSGIGEGDTELNFFGSLTDQDASGMTILLGVGVGKFVSDNLQLKLTQVLTVIDASDTFGYSPYVSAEYQIRPDPGSPFVVYVGGGAGMSLLSGTDLFTYSLFLTPVGGFKYFLSERMSLTYSLSYQFPLLEETCGTFDCFDSETTTLQNTLGFSIYY